MHSSRPAHHPLLRHPTERPTLQKSEGCLNNHSPDDRPLRQPACCGHFTPCCLLLLSFYSLFFFFQPQPMGHLQGQGLYPCSDVVVLSLYRHCSCLSPLLCSHVAYTTRYLCSYHVTFSFFEADLVYTMFTKFSPLVVSTGNRPPRNCLNTIASSPNAVWVVLQIMSGIEHARNPIGIARCKPVRSESPKSTGAMRRP